MFGEDDHNDRMQYLKTKSKQRINAPKSNIAPSEMSPRSLQCVYKKVLKRFDPTNISDQKSLNTEKFLAENLYFHNHQICQAKQFSELTN